MSTFQLSFFGMIRKVLLATVALLVLALTGASALADDLPVYRGAADVTGPADYREMLAGHPLER